MIEVQSLATEPSTLQPIVARAGELDDFVVARDVAQIPIPPERFLPEERDALASTLESHLAALEPHVAVLDGVRSLRQPEACVVISGQQPGLLCAPLYNVYKALQTVRLARTLAQAWERPVVPLFWNHADDHDVAEVHHVHVLNQNLDVQKIGLSGLSSGRQPLGRVRIDLERQNLVAVRSNLERIPGDPQRLEEALELLMPRSGETFAKAFTRAMTSLFGHLGLVVLEPDWIRADLSRALAKVVQQDVAHGLLERTEALAERGFSTAIEPSDAALLYRVDDTGRHALRLGGEGFRYDGEEGSRTASELAAEIVQDPQSWSAGALFRPLVQDLCLPVAAFVGGDGELAYHAQLTAAREAAGAPKTPFVRRVHCTLVDARSIESLQKLETTAASVLESSGSVLEDEGEDEAPPIVDDLRKIAADTKAALLERRDELEALDRGLSVNIKRTAGQVESLIDKICQKAERVYANRTGKGRRHVRRVQHTFFPRGLPQERVLGPLTFMAWYGREWLDELFDHIPAIERGHLIACLSGEPESPPKDANDER